MVKNEQKSWEIILMIQKLLEKLEKRIRKSTKKNRQFKKLKMLVQNISYTGICEFLYNIKFLNC
jgi:transcription termination factor NusB